MNRKEKALLVAQKAHQGQSYDIYPYIYHVKRVAAIAEELGYDEDIIVACLLHDTLEDTELSYNDLKKAFGTEVAEIVYCVTDELGRNRKERKENTYPKIRENWKATVVKICDRIANVEHSKEYNEKLYYMYLKEHKIFIASLDSVHHPRTEVHKAWEKLKTIL